MHRKCMSRFQKYKKEIRIAIFRKLNQIGYNDVSIPFKHLYSLLKS